MKGMGRRFLLAGVAAALAATAAGDSILSRLPFLSKGPGFDFNGDGSVRIAVLSPAVHAGGIDAAVWATDLEGILKASVKCPVRVGLVPLGKYRSMMGWWYAPDTDIEREKLVNGQTDLLLLAEHEEIVKRYPEFFFEGVRCVAALARANPEDLVLAANELRTAAAALGRMLGKIYSEDILDAIFSRFCVGK